VRAVKAVIVLVALTTVAHADPAKWVGSWTGKVTSKGCTDDGTKSVTLDVAVTSQDGLRSNGDLLEDGLGDLDWAADGANLTGNREGLKASLTASKKGAKLALTTDGGCKIKGTLVRATSGIADCDRLMALATTESQCPSMSSDTRGAKLDTAKASWKVWLKLRGKKRTAQAKQCKVDADVIAGEIASCGSGGGVTGIVECDDYLHTLDVLQQCSKMPDAAKQGMGQAADAIKQSIDAWKQSGSGQAGHDALSESCKSGADAVRQAITAVGC